MWSRNPSSAAVPIFPRALVNSVWLGQAHHLSHHQPSVLIVACCHTTKAPQRQGWSNNPWNHTGYAAQWARRCRNWLITGGKVAAIAHGTIQVMPHRLGIIYQNYYSKTNLVTCRHRKSLQPVATALLNSQASKYCKI